MLQSLFLYTNLEYKQMPAIEQIKSIVQAIPCL